MRLTIWSGDYDPVRDDNIPAADLPAFIARITVEVSVFGAVAVAAFVAAAIIWRIGLRAEINWNAPRTSDQLTAFKPAHTIRDSP